MMWFDARQWYWVVNNRPGLVYSSNVAQWVSDTDGTYSGWKAQGNIASGGDYMTDGEVAQVLASAGVDGVIVRNVQPSNWGNCTILDVVNAVQRAGVVVNLAGQGNQASALNAHYQLFGEPYATLAATQVYINAHGELPGNQPLPWAAYSGVVTFQDAASFSNVFQAIEDYFQGWKTWAYHGGTMPEWGAFAAATTTRNLWSIIGELTQRVAALERGRE